MQDLQEYAQKWAEHMAGRNGLKHSNGMLNGQSIGENIAFIGSSQPTDYAGNQSALVCVTVSVHTWSAHLKKNSKYLSW